MGSRADQHDCARRRARRRRRRRAQLDDCHGSSRGDRRLLRAPREGARLRPAGVRAGRLHDQARAHRERARRCAPRSGIHRAERFFPGRGVSARRGVRRRSDARPGAHRPHLFLDGRSSLSHSTRRARGRAQGRRARGRREGRL